MSWRQKVHRLVNTPIKNIPLVVGSAINGATKTALERFQYPSPGLNRAQHHPENLSLKSINLIHPDVFKPGFPKKYRQQFDAESSQIIELAQQALELKFDLLGSGLTDLKKFREQHSVKVHGRIPWHYDFKSGNGWFNDAYFSDIGMGTRIGADIKVPWELSRCHHLVPMGQAYVLTQNEEFAEGFINQVSDWIEQNPVKYGVNWVSPMDVALRACNWLLAWNLFKGAPSISKSFQDQFQRSLWDHGKHVFNHLEYRGKLSTNHYLSNLLGLAYLGLAFKNSHWLGFVRKEFKKEILNQVYDDGMSYEGSTSYHRLVLEIFSYYFMIMQKNGYNKNKIFGISQLKRFGRMFNTLRKFIPSHGLTPQIGDNDSGRVHVLGPTAERDHRYLLNWGALLLDNGSYKVQEWESSCELPWLFGFNEIKNYSKIKGKTLKELTARSPGSSGLVVMGSDFDHLTFNVAPNGLGGIGNHTHNDKLAFTLSLNGEEFFIDPGTGNYTAHVQQRNLFRSTKMHNTVEIDGEEQNRFIKGAVFALSNDARIEGIKHSENKSISARHRGYMRLKNPVMHYRTIKRKNSGKVWSILDEFKGRGQHHFISSLILGLSIQYSQIGPHEAHLIGTKGKVRLLWHGVDADMRLYECLYSPRYGDIQSTRRIQFQFTHVVPFQSEIKLEWMPQMP